MNLFEAKAIYDSKSGQFIEEFYINGNSVDCDEYYFYLEREKEIEDKKLDTVKNVEKLKDSPYEYDDTTDCKCEACNDYDNCCESGKCNCKDECNDKCDDCEESECLGCEECIDCDEECENYISSEEIEELKLIAYFTEEVLKRENCPQCIFDLIGDIYIKGKNIGWENHKNYIQMCNDE